MRLADTAPAVAAPLRRARGEVRDGRSGLWLWLALAITTLGVAGVFALLLAVSRIPGIERVVTWPVDFFKKGLVIHVVFSFVIWFLSALAACSLLATRMLTHAGRGTGVAGPLSAIVAAVSLPLLFIPAFLDRGLPTLNNYVPVIIDPLYYGGLAVLAVGVSIAIGGLLVRVTISDLAAKPVVLAVACAAGVYAIALVCIGIAATLMWGDAPTHAWNEDLFWGGGHVLQFTNTALMIAAWGLLMTRVPGAPEAAPPAVGMAALFLFAAALPAPAFYVLFEPFSARQVEAFTALQYLLGPPALIAAVVLLRRLPRPLPWRNVALLALFLSMILFSAGGAFGLFVDGADTRTPAHYHLVIAAVTLALMGLFHAVLLPETGRTPTTLSLSRLQLHLFAWGQLIASTGLFIAGGYGAPRKVAGDAQSLDVLWAKVGMAMNGGGALFAVAGGALFVWIIGTALVRRAAIEPGGAAAAAR
jgi:cytochrome c oxidase subunit I